MEDLYGEFWIFCTPVAVRIVKNADQLSAMEYSKQERENRKNAGLSSSSCHYILGKSGIFLCNGGSFFIS